MTKNLLGMAFLIAAGAAGNYFKSPIFFSADCLLGSIFSMLALQIFGLVPGLIVAVIASLGAYGSPNFHFHLFSLASEALVVGWLFTRKRREFVFLDTVYWLLIGMPLWYFFSRFYLNFHASTAAIFILTKAVNGISNALLARLLFMLLQFRVNRELFPLQEVIFNLLALFVLVPSLAILVYESRLDFGQFDASVRQALITDSRQTASSLKLWLHEKTIRISSLVGRMARHEVVSQANLDALRGLDSDLDMIGMMNKDAISTLFSPTTDEFGSSTIGQDFSDRPYLAELKRIQHPLLSEVVLSKVGKPAPIVLLAVPVVTGEGYEGYVAGVFNLQKIMQILSLAGQENGFKRTLIDRNGMVIASSSRDVPIMRSPLLRAADREYVPADGQNSRPPGRSGMTSWYERWQHTVYFVESEVGPNGEWKLIVEQPLSPHHIALSVRYATQLEVVFTILLITIAVAHVLSRRVIVSFGKLHDISHQLQQDIMTVEHVSWPTSMVVEVNFMLGTVKEMACRLIAKHREIVQINEGLADRVAERTRQLEDLNCHLEAQVEAEIARRHKQEQFLVQQAKLAAMGEMIGAIAHQWRQPLNTLALCVQNIREAFRSGELDRAYLETTVGESMAHISQMSNTIDDFRDFFKPDKEATTFDVMAAVGEVLTLFTAQLRANDISFVLTCQTHRQSFQQIEDIMICQAMEMVGYENEFKHVILNLISNAKEAICERRAQGLMADEEQGLISFDFRARGRDFVISVQDNGIGIPQPLRKRVFEPYFTTKSPDGGTGIGLYLAKIIIEDHHHGQLTLEESDAGAVFVITVPAVVNVEGRGGEVN